MGRYVGILLGSRGTTPEDLWAIYYFAPFSTAYELAWTGQWPLVGWRARRRGAVGAGLQLAA